MMRQADHLSAQAPVNRAQAKAFQRQIESWTQELPDTESLVARGAATPQKVREIGRILPALEAQTRASTDILHRRTLRAPQDGLVAGISVATPGAVIGMGAVVMEILPDADALVIRARMPPASIDTVQAGRKARVRLNAAELERHPDVALGDACRSVDPDRETAHGR